MGLFSNKKTQADGFSFAVDEVYALKEGKSVVVTGKMTEGKVTGANDEREDRQRVMELP